MVTAVQPKMVKSLGERAPPFSDNAIFTGSLFALGPRPLPSPPSNSWTFPAVFVFRGSLVLAPPVALCPVEGDAAEAPQRGPGVIGMGPGILVVVECLGRRMGRV